MVDTPRLLVGGLVVHLATRRWELEKDRRVERIKYLVAAFRTTMRDLDKSDPGASERFEAAIEDVTLFEFEEQVARRARSATSATRGWPVDYGPLPESLQNDVRRELGLKDVPLFAQGDAEY